MAIKAIMIDVVDIFAVDTGISHVTVPITQQDEAEKAAANLTKYHNRRFVTRVRNVPSILYPHLRGDSRVNLEKYLKW
jgi:predicted PhzF superfamily epimerase YddE/YHI9